MATLEDYRWLLGREGAKRLDAVARMLRDEQTDLVGATTQLRKELSPQRTHLVLEQVELRRRAKEKFGDAERLFFTDVGLQQASGEAVADYKAAQFGDGSMVADLCCGIGGDLMSLARRGPAVGVDRDEVATLLAAANCRATGLPGVEVRTQDVQDFSRDDARFVHIDPDRRPGGRRTTTLALHQPGEAFLDALLERFAGGAVKLAPATEVPPRWESRCQLEWVSHRRECKQLVAWFGTLARQVGGRAATMLRSGHRPETFHQKVDLSAPSDLASGIGPFLYEPDPAIIAGRLVGAVASRYELKALAPGVAYLTGDGRVADRMLAGFEVLAAMPFDEKRVKAALRSRRAGPVEVKKRGVEMDPESLRRRLQVDGDETVTLILTPFEGNVMAILARRLQPCGR